MSPTPPARNPRHPHRFAAVQYRRHTIGHLIRLPDGWLGYERAEMVIGPEVEVQRFEIVDKASGREWTECAPMDFGNVSSFLGHVTIPAAPPLKFTLWPTQPDDHLTNRAVYGEIGCAREKQGDSELWDIPLTPPPWPRLHTRVRFTTGETHAPE